MITVIYMADVEPLLFRFKKHCLSPTRASTFDNAIYEDSLDILMVLEDGRYIPAINAKEDHSFATKKADIEKGDDQKDSLM